MTKPARELREVLIARPTVGNPDPNDQFAARLFDTYKLCVEMADRLSARRHTTNSFFVSLNTAVTGVFGYLAATKDTLVLRHVVWLLAPAGFLLSLMWLLQILSYRNLATAKYAVIQEIEKAIGIRPYFAEWELVGRGKTSGYRPFTHLEAWVPAVFGVLYTLAFGWSVFWSWLARVL